MWPKATNPEDWLPQSHFIKAIATLCVWRTGGSEIHERVAQLFVVVHRQGLCSIVELSPQMCPMIFLFQGHGIRSTVSTVPHSRRSEYPPQLRQYG